MTVERQAGGRLRDGLVGESGRPWEGPDSGHKVWHSSAVSAPIVNQSIFVSMRKRGCPSSHAYGADANQS